ncbi:MAG TPA: tetratricopeptide repeat protein [Pirellulales bacterium]|jgi:tetratricopeptide (TPR) repeat protein|nr:tetratricopeptide repeat protein [Pirellulales bacterium]
MATTRRPRGAPSELNALVALAQREHSAGRLAEAVAAYRKIVGRWPDIAEAHNNLGNVLECQGHLVDAVICYERAVVLKPGLFQAHNNLGNISRKQGKLDQALARYEQAIAIRPDFAEAHNNLAIVLLNRGNLDQAIARFERAIALSPDYPEAHNNLGVALGNLRKLDEAVTRFEQAITLRPDYAEAHNNLGNALREQGKSDQAMARYRQALALKPNYVDAHNNLGGMFQHQGSLDQAVAQYEQAVALAPNLPEIHNNLANALTQQGKFDEAAAHYRQALAIRPDYPEAHHDFGHAKTFSAGDADLAVLKNLAADAGRLPPSKLLYVHFALGKALEDVGDYPRAFEHWLQGNALKRQQIDYDETSWRRTFQLVAKVFGPEVFDRFHAVGDPSSTPIFIVGMIRSGSTLVEQILASHPLVHAAGELENLDRVVQAVSDSAGQPVPACIEMLDGDRLDRLGQAYLASLPTPPTGKVRITDKAPGNFFHVGLIRLILPNARIIHTVRDPADTCVSCYSKLFTHGQPFSYDLAELGRYYRWYHELMQHWRNVLPAGAMLDVSYENVVDDLEQQARRLIDFCGLPWDDRCLKFHETRRPITTASNVQVRRPLYRSSVQRWRRYEAHLQPLLTELQSCR